LAEQLISGVREIEYTGEIVSLPASGLAGEWVVGSNTYTVDNRTDIDTDWGPIAVGACVEVTVRASEPTRAREVDTVPARRCAGGGGNSNQIGSLSLRTAIGEIEYTGEIRSLPASGLEGDWVVGTRTFTVDRSTEIETENGPVAVGACVEVTVKASAPTVAYYIETIPARRCGSVVAHAPHSTAPTGLRARMEIDYYGTIVSLPASGLEGEWVVGSNTYTVDRSTQIDMEYGPIEVGACVKVTVKAGWPTVAYEIETERPRRCQ
jgi:hypothetical protein